MENDKTNNIYFPLCCLNFNKDIKKTTGLLISFGLVEFGKKLVNEIELNESDFDRIENYIVENNLSKCKNKLDKYIILSAIKLNISIGNLVITKNNHSEINTYIKYFENIHGKDAKVKVHSGLLFDVRDNKFDERMFRVYCAILSVIGKKQFIRITNKTISFRMLGFKSEEVFIKEIPKYKLMTARQIKTTTDKLSERNFFAMRTYKNRLTFYSTKFRENEFDEVLTNSIAMNRAKKELRNINNQKVNTGVDEKLKQFREKLLSGQSIKEIKSNMELVKTG